MHCEMHAVITAGGRVNGELAVAIGTTVKALATVSNATMLQKSVDAARAAGAGRIGVVCGQDAQTRTTGVDDFIPESTSGTENIHRALSFYGGEPLLFLTSDMPFVSGEAVRAFLDRAPDSVIAMPLAAAADYEARFPGAPEHATVLAHERVANGSAFFFPRGAAPVVDDVAQRLFEGRKNLARMALLLGPALLLKFALKRLTIADIEKKAARMLGVSVRAIRDCPPELCFDVDTIEDYRYAIAHS